MDANVRSMIREVVEEYLEEVSPGFHNAAKRATDSWQEISRTNGEPADGERLRSTE
jgi:hypothetical protein